MASKQYAKTANKVAVQGTNDSSIVSKHSMAKMGYFSDEFIEYFIKKPSRRAPLINRGYYVRAKAIDAAISDFLQFCTEKGDHAQIISLGAGFDTLYFRINDRWKDAAIIFEIDFPDLVKRKVGIIQGSEPLANLLPKNTSFQSKEMQNGCIVFDSPNYKLLGLDLTHVDALEQLLRECDLDVGLPTLLLSECAITYMDEARSSALIKWASGYFRNAQIVIYEQIAPYDGFGKVMLQHFCSLGSPLRSINKYPDVPSQRQRYLNLGWTQCYVIDMNTFYQQKLPIFERERIEKLEMFEEFEEFQLKCSHYVLICAMNNKILPVPSWFYDSLEMDETGAGTTPSNFAPLKLTETFGNIARFGHCSILLGDKLIVTVGGFGPTKDGGHRRLRDIHVMALESETVFTIACQQTSFQSLKDQTILVIGGRTSPANACSDILRFRFGKDLSDSGKALQIEKINAENSAGLEARWRHTASVVSLNGKEKIVIFGGRNPTCPAMDDCHLLDPEGWMWTEIKATGNSPGARHSHAACTWNQNVIISGGLSRDSTPLKSLYLLDCLKNEWTELPVLITPRYSHTACQWRDKMFLLGGVNTSIRPPPGVAVIDLISGRCTELQFPVKVVIGQCPLVSPFCMSKTLNQCA